MYKRQEETLIKNHDQQKLVYLSPKGKPFKQVDAEKFSQSNGVSILCGHFEGIDQRVIDIYKVEEISMGDYVLTGGEVASFAFLDAIIRLLPGVLGNEISIKDESFSDNLLEYPQYTKPQEYKNIKVPDVLLSGNHEKIAEMLKHEKCQEHCTGFQILPLLRVWKTMFFFWRILWM